MDVSSPSAPRAERRLRLAGDQEDPPASREAVARASVAVILAVAFVVWLVVTFADMDIERRQMQRRLDRVHSDLRMARATLLDFQSHRGRFPAPNQEHALPQEFSDFYAEMRGNAPLFQEEGRIARLDLLGASGHYKDPLGYALADGNWLVRSCGPDRKPDIDAASLPSLAGAATLREALLPLTYDPTNGLASAGDLWIASEAFPERSFQVPLRRRASSTEARK